MSDNILEVRKLDKAFGGLKILKNVEFDVKRGQRLALIGPNGAGKSTLLNTIGGQGPATAGTVMFFTKDEKTGAVTAHNITKMSPNQRLHCGMGKSFQVNNLFWQFDLLLNIKISIYGSEKSHMHFFGKFDNNKEIEERAEYLLRTVKLWEKRHEMPGALSYGEQRMLEMAMAFAAKPQMVCLDEPSAGLPTAEVGQFIEILKELAKDSTLLFCAHDMDLVFALADEIMVLYFGEILAKGEPKAIANDPRVQEIYLGGKDDTYDEVRG